MVKKIYDSQVLFHPTRHYDTLIHFDTGVPFYNANHEITKILDHPLSYYTGVSFDVHPHLPTFLLKSNSGPVNYFELNRYFVAISDRFESDHPFHGKKIPFSDKIYFGGEDFILASGHFEYDDNAKQTTVVSNNGTYVFCYHPEVIDDGEDCEEDPVEDVAESSPKLEIKSSDFEKELESLINRYCEEDHGGNTPDFILASYLKQSLKIFGNHVHWREVWYGRVTPDEAKE